MNDFEFHELKTASEKYLVGINFSPRLATGETLSSATVKAYDDTGNEVTSTILEGVYQIGSVTGKNFTADANGTWVVITVKNGTAGQIYKVHFIVTTSTSQKFEGIIELEISE